MGRSGWVTNLLYDARPGQNGPMERDSQYGGRPYYYNELFLDMQHIIDFVFISRVAEQGLSYRWQSHYVFHYAIGISKNISDLLIAYEFIVPRFKANKDGKSFNKNDYKLKYERFPFPSYTDDPFLRSFSDNLPLVLFLAFIYFGAQVLSLTLSSKTNKRLVESLSIMIWTIVYMIWSILYVPYGMVKFSKTAKMVAIEKETKLKEYMLMMGLSRNALWASWFLHYFLLLIIPCLLTMHVLTSELSSYGSVLQMSDSFIIFIFLMLWESFIHNSK